MAWKAGRIGLLGSLGGGGGGIPSAKGLIGLAVFADAGDMGRGYAAGGETLSGWMGAGCARPDCPGWVFTRLTRVWSSDDEGRGEVGECC